jgi:2-dehydropantoate 2-reductase
VARGEALQALRTHGWRLRQGETLHRAPLAAASDEPRDLGAMDLVVVAVKGPALTEVARRIAPLLATHTLVLPAMNGVPWWFAQTTPQLGGEPLHSVDPGGVIADHIPLAQVLGCVVHASTYTPEPGLVAQRMGQGLIVGEPAGGLSDRARRLADLLAGAGFDATVSADIRQDIWYKLWGNMTMNPVSAITGASVDRIMADPLVLAFCTAAMHEAAAVGARIGCAVAQSPEDRHAVTRKLGAFRTSMQNDVDAGRAIELDALVSVVREIAQRLDIATPNIDALLGLTRLFAQQRGLYPQAAPGER